MKNFYVYIMASRKDGALYIGVTNDLIRRIYEHRNDLAEGFTKRYRVHKLVYYEDTENTCSAIAREKSLKIWNRAWKIRLIQKNNPDWKDLYDNLAID
jgi:putative endonuclease